MKFTLRIGENSASIAIVPTGLMMRLFGVDPMGLRRPRGETFWIARQKGSSSAESLEKPF